MEDFRNWLVQYRQAPWDNNRDVFIHGKHKTKLYDFDNHRKGLHIPGGYNIQFRRQILKRLLDTERLVMAERGKPLISDDELANIQECWCEDGDLNMSVKEIAYDRNYEHLINPMYFKVLASVKQMQNFDNLPKYYARNFSWTWIYNSDGSIAFDTTKFCERYFAQMAIQLERRGYDSFLIMGALKSRAPLSSKDGLIKFIKSLPLETKMNFVDATKENYIRKEWSRDKIGFLTFLEMYEKKEIETPTEKNLFGYDSDYSEHFEALDEFNSKDGDIIECESISLDDKMRFFDGW